MISYTIVTCRAKHGNLGDYGTRNDDSVRNHTQKSKSTTKHDVFMFTETLPTNECRQFFFFFLFLAALVRRKRFCEHEYVVFGSTFGCLRMISYTIVGRRAHNPENYRVFGFARIMACVIVALARVF